MPNPSNDATHDRNLSAQAQAQNDAIATDTAVEPIEYDGIDTRTPEANYLTRSNIVPGNSSPAHIQAAIRDAANQTGDVEDLVRDLTAEQLADALLPPAAE